MINQSHHFSVICVLNTPGVHTFPLDTILYIYPCLKLKIYYDYHTYSFKACFFLQDVAKKVLLNKVLYKMCWYKIMRFISDEVEAKSS